jgi:NADPH:quinone reductase-like Zn-dependent oxidoreductase
MRHAPNSLFKRIAEHDFAGEVVDPNGSDFKVGENIYGMIDVSHSLFTRQGSLTSYTFAPAACIVRRPSNVTPVEAAGLTLAGLTAYQALFDLGKLEKGQTVFINGGSTSVGAFAIQLAKAKGCKVVASASGKNEQFVKDLGADEVLILIMAFQSVDCSF